MIQYADVRQVHLEITDKCNASCPMCPRTDHGGPVNPRLRNIEMSLELAKKVFPEDFLRGLHFIQLCGNFGDPIVAKDMLEILEYFRSVNPKLSLGIHTNGSLRTPAWWAGLGKVLKGPGDYCKFALDGLADTNHLYRRNTLFSKIIENAKAFIASGGIAHWEYLVFQHNQHQVEDARTLASEMGFKQFYVKKTSRFFNYQNGKNEPYPIYDKEKNIVGYLNPPDEEEFINKVTLQSEKPGETRKSTYKVEEHINCLTSRAKTIYISAAGEVFPCCFLGGQVRYDERGPDGDFVAALATKPGIEISAGERPMQAILDSDWFPSIQRSWTASKQSERIGTCLRLCTEKKLIVDGEYA